MVPHLLDGLPMVTKALLSALPEQGMGHSQAALAGA
jgi:hypothetical protein